MTKFIRKAVFAMAFSRDKWVERATHSLEGALGEYAKHKMAPLAKIDFDWRPEVKRILKVVENLCDPKVQITKTKFNRAKALNEALVDASSAQRQITDARNSFTSEYIETPIERVAFLQAFNKLDLRAEDLLLEMLNECSPELFGLAQLGD